MLFHNWRSFHYCTLPSLLAWARECVCVCVCVLGKGVSPCHAKVTSNQKTTLALVLTLHLVWHGVSSCSFSASARLAGPRVPNQSPVCASHLHSGGELALQTLGLLHPCFDTDSDALNSDPQASVASAAHSTVFLAVDPLLIPHPPLKNYLHLECLGDAVVKWFLILGISHSKGAIPTYATWTDQKLRIPTSSFPWIYVIRMWDSWIPTFVASSQESQTSTFSCFSYWIGQQLSHVHVWVQGRHKRGGWPARR